MTITIRYDLDGRTGAARLCHASDIWHVAMQMRRHLPAADAGRSDAGTLMACVRHIEVNGRAIEIVWDADHEVHDENGMPVFGVCETDPDNPGVAYVSVNGPLLRDRPDILASTIAHELGHVVFDVPGVQRRYRSVTAGTSLHASERASEWRANEFMGALLVPAFELHRELLRLAAGEGLRLTRAQHHGRPGCPVVDGRSNADALAGVVTVLAGHFGVSDGFVDMRLRRYRLVSNGLEMR